jgi:hypothetical protein
MKLQGSEVQDHETLQSQIGKIAENRLPLSGLEIFHRRQIKLKNLKSAGKHNRKRRRAVLSAQLATATATSSGGRSTQV